jgi:hypothetical protein
MTHAAFCGTAANPDEEAALRSLLKETRSLHNPASILRYIPAKLLLCICTGDLRKGKRQSLCAKQVELRTCKRT